MREIKYHNDETIKVDGLHFYGCSFVAGQELLDEEMGSPMSIPVEQMARQKNESVEQYYKRKLSRELLFKKKIKLEILKSSTLSSKTATQGGWLKGPSASASPPSPFRTKRCRC